VTVSGILGFLSLLGCLAVLGQALWKTIAMTRNRFCFSDHSFDEIPKVVRLVLRHCLNQGTVVITDRHSKRFVRFRKYIPRKGDYGLDLEFPETAWSEGYFSKLRDSLITEGNPFRETREVASDVTALIHVDCGKNIEKAAELTRRCMFELFGQTPQPDTRFKSTVENYSSFDEVDDPGYEHPSWSQSSEKLRSRTGIDFKLAMKAAAYTVGIFLCCYPALWWTWFVADPTSPDWQWPIVSFRVAGSYETLILLPIFCALFVITRGTASEISRLAKSKPRPKSPIQRMSAVLVYYALPMAVIGSWIGI
jgi:hypothetical protein